MTEIQWRKGWVKLKTNLSGAYLFCQSDQVTPEIVDFI